VSESALFDVDPVAAPERPKIAVDKTFRPFEPDQILLLPPSLRPPELTEGYACDVAFPDRAVPESS